jgi:Zn-dependent M32 family carboxypeptidase
MMAAQLFETAEKSIPDLRGKISRGDFKPLR